MTRDRISHFPIDLRRRPYNTRTTANSQIGVTDYKYLASDDLLPPGRVTRRVRIASFAIQMAHSHCFHPLLSNGSS